MSFVVNDSCLESLSAIAAQHEDWIIQQAIALLEKRVFKAGAKLLDPTAVRDYLRVKLVAEPNEIFGLSPDKAKIRFFSQLSGERRTADGSDLLFLRQQTGAGRGRAGLYVPSGRLDGIPSWQVAL
ncbi:hypothetical protein [Aerosticca soli]|uniref:hypothetical protein n=1 Tax=Aerosticca soli TaxID=2010829 RepID=UPI002682ADA5